MSAYNWKAIPEATWTAFSAAIGGLVAAIMVAADVDAAIVAAVTVFITAGFRMVVALMAALTSADGTVSSGTGSDMPPIPPSG